MKIAILTSGILPIPAVLGGAVETLIDFYLEYNNTYHLHDITIYSVFNRLATKHPARNSDVNHYHYIDTTSLWAKIKRKVFLHTSYRREKNYNNHFIEYYYNEAFKEIIKSNYDIIIMENRPSYALKLKKHINAKLVCHLHNELLTSHTPGAVNIYNSLDKILTVSDYIAKCVKTINPNDEKCVTVYNGINLEAFRPNRNTSINRSDIGLSPKDFVLVFCGRINEEKGIHKLIKAVQILKEESHIKLLVIGGSFFGNELKDNDFIKEIKKTASTIKNHIVFTGYVAYEKIPEYLKLSDVAVIPSIWNDPFPTTVLEAQAMGLPIIASRKGGIPEEVTNKNAILLENDDNFEKSLAESIYWLYKHPEQIKIMGELSLIHSSKFNKERFAKDFFNAL